MNAQIGDGSGDRLASTDVRWLFGRGLAIPLFCVVLLGSASPATAASAPPIPAAPVPAESGIDWGSLIGQVMLFQSGLHAVRVATQDYTRDRLGGKFFMNWGRSIGNLHGWSDGDTFVTNYVLHPMQGATNGYLFVQNARGYRRAVFGKNRLYWRSRAQSTFFSFVASEELEIGLISEANIGYAQKYYPQQGLIDHVITPTAGLAAMIGEDAVDKYFIRRLEMRTRKTWVRGLLRSTLNPDRSLANVLAFRAPWFRYTRSNNLHQRFIENYPAPVEPPSPPLHIEDWSRSVPAFEVVPTAYYTRLDFGHTGALNCAGGGASTIFGLNRWMGIAATVEGCTMLSPGVNLSGDTLTYVAGPRLTYRSPGGWVPYAELLAGGDKLSTETIYPDRKPPNLNKIPRLDLPAVHESYTSQAQTNSFALRTAVGLDRIINQAFAIRILSMNNTHLWAHTLNGRHYPNNFAISTGVTLRFGTW